MMEFYFIFFIDVFSYFFNEILKPTFFKKYKNGIIFRIKLFYLILEILQKKWTSELQNNIIKLKNYILNFHQTN